MTHDNDVIPRLGLLFPRTDRKMTVSGRALLRQSSKDMKLLRSDCAKVQKLSVNMKSTRADYTIAGMVCQEKTYAGFKKVLGSLCDNLRQIFVYWA